MTSEQIAHARAMLAEGHTRTNVAAHFGITRYALRFNLDPKYRAQVNRRARERRAVERAKPRPTNHVPEMTREAKADGERLLRGLPADTRGFTARLLGDPLPGRSALDHKREVARA
ncbi:hypothetical protein [Pelagibacterium sp. H642]|uniref:hypothetical protein n=1 Tax=Pelagibacterium sp. H642 TaxID=1881069 RepID=UPI002814A29A|nr:hypothetical protein [Pelagibacterium sp. H642]WMT90112.1 hypothetical protein NO934_15135 [Pelagibacterium sp. H642]